jgi:hypothetical protein
MRKMKTRVITALMVTVLGTMTGTLTGFCFGQAETPDTVIIID